jgi:Tol biopolymer transport system component
MTIRSGTRLGPYEIVGPLGAGGMGEVFTARDTRLERIVAIKILPAAVADNQIKRTRLQREARVISQLNHPHICMLYDAGSEDGIDFLVMEHLEGHSLAEHLTKGALPLDEVVRIGVEIAEALHGAHRQQVVHRDLKPGNVMLTRSGAKLLDFGLAKFADMTVGSLTADGAVAGTPRYMAPEQMEGRRADHRADIFALGCVLYEMRTGNPAVGGVQPVKPPELDRLISKCLERDPERRCQSAWDVAEELRWIGQASQRTRRVWSFRNAIAVLAVAAIAASLMTLRSRPQQRPHGAIFSRLTNAAGVEAAPAISPDGTLVAYESSVAGNADIYLQRIGGRKPVNLTLDSKSDDSMPAFSHDGQRIAFRSERDGGGIFVMGATGESARRVSDFGFNPAWSPDGEELAVSSQPVAGGPYVPTPTGEIWRIEVASGRRQQVVKGDAVGPTWSPHGTRLAFCRSYRGDILSVPSTGGDPVVVTQGPPRDWSPVWSADGYIYFASDRGGSVNLWRVAVDEMTGMARGEPEAVTTPALWAGPLGISGDGKKIVYCARSPQSALQRNTFDPVQERVVGDAVQMPLGNLFIAMPDVSPDGLWIAFCTLYEQEDIYIVRSDGTDLRKLTDDHFVDTWPRWSPDGKRIAFASNRVGVGHRTDAPFQIWAVNADGSGLQQLTALDGSAGGPPVWSPDGRGVIVRGNKNVCASLKCFVDVTGVLPATKAGNIPVRLLENGYFGPAEAWSRDGKWLVGTAWPAGKVTDRRVFVASVENGLYHLLPRPLNGTSRWMSDSRRLLLLDERKLYVVDRNTSTAREIRSFGFEAAGIALSKDDRTIYVLRASDEADIWLAELH